MKQDIKKEAIIQAAEKRFIHFTVAKTTMAEIAGDQGISKPLLYYYFPDKLALYAAVISHVVERMQQSDGEALKHSDPLKNIIAHLQRRKDFVMQYYNIIEFIKVAIDKAPEELKPFFQRVKTADFKAVRNIFEKGKKEKLLNIRDLDATTQLFLNCLDGLRYVLLQQDGVLVFPTKEQFDAVFAKEKEFAGIFVKGLQF